MLEFLKSICTNCKLKAFVEELVIKIIHLYTFLSSLKLFSITVKNKNPRKYIKIVFINDSISIHFSQSKIIVILMFTA